ncbi:MAG: hypothetical protein GXP39_08695 [Chloroflexi bacterium]|nr:hypothetical protein [Chloroflexota bacterium]
MLLFGVVLVGATGWLALGRSPAAASSDPVAPAQYVLEGRVYDGNVGEEPPLSSPIQGVTVSLYCSNNAWEKGTFLRSTVTSATGWYGLEVRETCEYYNIVETDPPGYTSMGASTVGGSVIDANWIQYTQPLDGLTLTGNKFWDRREATETPTPTPTSTSPLTSTATPTPTPVSTFTPTPTPIGTSSPQLADLELTKSSSQSEPIAPGAKFYYELKLYNKSSSESIDHPVVTDTLPSEVQFTGSDPPLICTQIASRPPHDVVRCDIPTWISPNSAYLIDLYVQVDQDACGFIRNEALASSKTPDPDLTNNITFLNTLVGPCDRPAIAVRKQIVSPSNRVAQTGDLVTFEIEIKNIGNAPLSPVTLTDTFDDHFLSYVSATPHPTHLAALPGQGILHWADLTAPPPIGFGHALAPGDSFTVTVRLRAKQPGVGDNCVLVAGEAGKTQVKDNACDYVRVQDPDVDLQISKRLIQPVSGTAVVSDTVRFEIRLTNVGTEPITSLRLRDTYDTAYLSFTGADYDPDDPADDGVLDWSDLTSSPPKGFGHPLMPGQTETFIVSFHAKAPTSPGQPTLNCIRAWYRYAESPEHGTSQHCARVGILTEPGPAVDIEKVLYQPTSGVAYPGDTVRFSFVLANTGTTTFTTVSLIDTYDTSCLSFVSTGWPPGSPFHPDDPTDDGRLDWSNYTALWPSMPPGGWLQVWPGVEFQAKAGAGCDPTINTLEALATDQQGLHAYDVDHESVRIVLTPEVTPTPTTIPTPTPTRVGGGYRLYFPLILKNYPLPLIFSDDFSGGALIGWKSNHGTWTVSGGRMRGQYGAGNAWNMRSEGGTNFIYEGTVNLVSGNAVGLTFRSSADGTSSYDVILDAVDGVFKISKRPPYQVLASYSMSVQRNHPYRVKVVVRGNKIEAYLDGVKRLTAVDSTYGNGRFGVMLFRATATYDDLEARRLP